MPRQMERNKSCICHWCRQPFEAVRYNAEFCSARCRKAHNRHLQAVAVHLAVAMTALDTLATYRAHEGNQSAFDAMLRIRTRVNSILDVWE